MEFEPASGDNLGFAPQSSATFSVCERCVLGVSLVAFARRMSLFSRGPKLVASPWGDAAVHESVASVLLGRFRGVCIDLW